MALVLFASACGSSNDPTTWTEAGNDGNVRKNFVEACKTANSGSAQMTDTQANRYCTEAFVELVDYYGGQIVQPGDSLQDSSPIVEGRDFAAFLKLDRDLRKDPTSVPPDIRELLDGVRVSVTN